MSEKKNWRRQVELNRESRAERQLRQRARWATALPGWHNRRHRRALALLAGAALATTAVFGHSDENMGPVRLLAWVLGIVVLLLAWCLMRVLTTGIAEGLDSTLDERERELRNGAWRGGYYVAAIGILAMMVFVAAARRVPPLVDYAPGLMWTLFMTALAAPTMVLAWRLPDDDPADFADSGDHGYQLPPLTAGDHRGGDHRG